MEHKAFVLKYRDFEAELLPIVEAALSSHDTHTLLDFIEAQRDSLSDPYEGEPLGKDWRDRIEAPDVHQYGDFALTKYYDPTDDIGLGNAWHEIQRLLETKLGASDAALGRRIESEGKVFDPGKMGSYFQSEADVRHNLSRIERAGDPSLEALAVILKRAAGASAGLYVTF